MLNWFDLHPPLYWCLVCLVVAGLLVAAVLPLVRGLPGDERRFDWVFGLAILAVLVAGRWPSLLMTGEYNVDEGQFVAGALTLRHDPVFWRAVDGMSSGPLNYYALLPAGWLHGTDDYFTARATGLCLIAGALLLVHATCVGLFGRSVARVSLGAPVLFEALTTHRDFLHYSSEVLSVTLTAAAVYAAARRLAAGGHWRWNLLGGAILGAMPLAKLQITPLAAALAAAWLAAERWIPGRVSSDRRRGIVALVFGALTVPAIFALMLTWTAEWPDAVTSYLRSNLVYLDSSALRIPDVMGEFWRSAVREDSLLLEWLLGSGLGLLLTLPCARTSSPRARTIALAAVGLAAVALACILAPRRAALHYWQLFVIPWTLVLAAVTSLMLEAIDHARRVARAALLVLLLGCGCGGVLVARAGSLRPEFGPFVQFQTPMPLAVNAAVREIERYGRPGEPLATWGWMPHLYVATRMRQATREAHTELLLIAGPYVQYYRQRYLSDFRRSDPPVFVDTIGPLVPRFQNPIFAHESALPELGAYVREHYREVATFSGLRIFVRRDRLAKCARPAPESEPGSPPRSRP